MTDALHRLGRRTVYRFVTSVSAQPAVYYGLRILAAKMDPLCVRRETDLVIEGYPRSANSTTVYGFLARQRGAVRIAHHKHHVAQVLRGLEWGIPTVVLVRPAHDAIVSLLSLDVEGQVRRGGDINADPTLTFRDAARAWRVFYREIVPVSGTVVVASFEEAISNLTTLIERINTRCGTSFRTKRPAGDNRLQLGWHATPNPIRSQIKARLSREFKEALARDPHLRRVLLQNDDIYARLLG